MRNILNITLLIVALGFGAYGQKLVKPKLLPNEPTEPQLQLIREGAALHDAKKYDEAISKYRAVLAENPECASAMYELSMTLYAKGDKEKAMEIAYEGSKYISDELPLFYGTMANILDDYGKPQEAIDIYTEGLKLLAGDHRFGKYRSSLYYNLGVTHVKQKMYPEARQDLKSAVENDYSYASPHYMLSIVYDDTKYKVPALLAASRFITFETNTARTANAAAIIVEVMKPAQKDPKTGSFNIMLDINTPTDEGDFGGINMLLPTFGTPIGKDKKDKNKTEQELFVDGLGTLISILAEDKKLRSTFVGKNYIPFMTEIKKRGYLEVFGYMVLYINGDQAAKPWLVANDEKLGAFIKWAKAYQQP